MKFVNQKNQNVKNFNIESTDSDLSPTHIQAGEMRFIKQELGKIDVVYQAKSGEVSMSPSTGSLNALSQTPTVAFWLYTSGGLEGTADSPTVQNQTRFTGSWNFGTFTASEYEFRVIDTTAETPSLIIGGNFIGLNDGQWRAITGDVKINLTTGNGFDDNGQWDITVREIANPSNLSTGSYSITTNYQLTGDEQPL